MLKVKADSTGLGPSTFGTGLQVCWLTSLNLLMNIPVNPKDALLDRDLVTVEAI